MTLHTRRTVAALLIWAMPLSAWSSMAAPCWLAGGGHTVAAQTDPGAEHAHHHAMPSDGMPAMSNAHDGAPADGRHAASSNHCPCCDGCLAACSAASCTAMTLDAGLHLHEISSAGGHASTYERAAGDLTFRPPLRPPITSRR